MEEGEVCLNLSRAYYHRSDLTKAMEFSQQGLIREIKIHVYRIRQTANVSGEFLRIENKQLKKVQNDSCGQN